MNTVFYISAVIAIVSTALVITRRNIVHALLYTVLSFLAVAVMFFLLGAPFAAALQIIVYAGAILVLFVFIVMMVNSGKIALEQEKKWTRAGIWIGPGILSFVLLGVYIFIFTAKTSGPFDALVITPKEVGVLLFTKYLLGVEIAAMLLLSGIIGAYHLGHQDQNVKHRFWEDNHG
jgi:NADH-quinone oxidoreductase subunit J